MKKTGFCFCQGGFLGSCCCCCRRTIADLLAYDLAPSKGMNAIRSDDKIVSRYFAILERQADVRGTFINRGSSFVKSYLQTTFLFVRSQRPDQVVLGAKKRIEHKPIEIGPSENMPIEASRKEEHRPERGYRLSLVTMAQERKAMVK